MGTSVTAAATHCWQLLLCFQMVSHAFIRTATASHAKHHPRDFLQQHICTMQMLQETSNYLIPMPWQHGRAVFHLATATPQSPTFALQGTPFCCFIAGSGVHNSPRLPCTKGGLANVFTCLQLTAHVNSSNSDSSAPVRSATETHLF